MLFCPNSTIEFWGQIYLQFLDSLTGFVQHKSSLIKRSKVSIRCLLGEGEERQGEEEEGGGRRARAGARVHPVTIVRETAEERG